MEYIFGETRFSDEKLNSDDGYIFIDQLVYETEDPGFIRDQLLNVFFPARDASSAGASFIFFILARHPDVWKKLRNETLNSKEPLKNRYLLQVIDECKVRSFFQIYRLYST